MSMKVEHFLDIKDCKHQDAKVVIIPVPIEKTTSYQKGTINGPNAIIEASPNLEDYDIETNSTLMNYGIFTKKSLPYEKLTLIDSLKEIEEEVSSEIRTGHFPVVLGGEHSLSYGVFKGIFSEEKDIAVIHFDAHTDLREQYEDNNYSHACVMKRIRDLTVNTLSVGIRSMCEDEARYISSVQVPIIFADEFLNEAKALASFEEELKKLPDNVFVTFDVDVFDPSIIPQTGTPEPGGLNWYQVTTMLRKIFEQKKVFAVDIVEFMPNSVEKSSDFTIAKLVYKIITYYKMFGKKIT